MEDFELELKVGFLDEAAQALSDAENCFLLLETNPSDIDNLNKIFRLAHNLKGSSKAVGFAEMGNFTHEFETFIIKIKNGDLNASKEIVGLLLRANDHLKEMVDGLKANINAQFDSTSLLQEMQTASNKTEAAAPVEEPVNEPEPAEIVEEPVLASEPAPIEISSPVEVVTNTTPEPAPAPAHPVAAAKPPASEGGEKSIKTEESIRVSIGKLENLLNYVGEMVILQSVLREQSMIEDSQLMRKTVNQLGKVSKEIQDISMSLRMIPVKPTFQKMQRIVRDTAIALGKDVGITVSGEDTELDKTVLEKINDPLVHLIRNSVDHGIESAELRQSRKKATKGEVRLRAFHQSGKLVIEVSDDGGGLDPEKLKTKAIEKGILKPGAQLSEKECYSLIFAPGFTTKEKVTDVSGRGVGMDVVRTNITDLSGEIQIESKLYVGTTFRIILPLTLAIIEAMILSFGNEKLVMPISSVHETIRPTESQIQRTTGLGQVLILRGENLPLYRLGDFFGLKSKKSNSDMIAVVIKSGPKPYAILVDDILGQFQVVVKQLGPELKDLKGVSGSTILGDGKPCLILEPLDLIKRKITSMPQDISSPSPSPAGGKAA